MHPLPRCLPDPGLHRPLQNGPDPLHCLPDDRTPNRDPRRPPTQNGRLGFRLRRLPGSLSVQPKITADLRARLSTQQRSTVAAPASPRTDPELDRPGSANPTKRQRNETSNKSHVATKRNHRTKQRPTKRSSGLSDPSPERERGVRLVGRSFTRQHPFTQYPTTLPKQTRSPAISRNRWLQSEPPRIHVR